MSSPPPQRVSKALIQIVVTVLATMLVTLIATLSTAFWGNVTSHQRYDDTLETIKAVGMVRDGRIEANHQDIVNIQLQIARLKASLDNCP